MFVRQLGMQEKIRHILVMSLDAFLICLEGHTRLPGVVLGSIKLLYSMDPQTVTESIKSTSV
jgi:hypothetical protein